jgi:hypothetical protein
MQAQQMLEARSSYVNTSTEEAPFGEVRPGAAVSLGTVTRRFEGNVAGESVAAVLIARSAPDRLGYVATDRFTGRVGDRSGSFAFQHGGSIDRGVLTSFGYVVPGSGTDELSGLRGEVHIAFTPPATHTLTLSYDLTG